MIQKLKKIFCLTIIASICMTMIRCQTDETTENTQLSDISAARSWAENNKLNLEALNFTEEIQWQKAVVSSIQSTTTIEVPLLLSKNTTTNVIEDKDYKTYMSLLFIKESNNDFRVLNIVYTTKNQYDYDDSIFNLYNIKKDYAGYITIQNSDDKILYSGEYVNGNQTSLHNFASDQASTSKFVCQYYVTVGPFTTCNSWSWVPDDAPSPQIPNFPGGPIRYNPCYSAANMTVDFKSPSFLSAKNSILSADPTIEHSITMTKNNGVIGQAPMNNGGTSNVQVNTTITGAFAAMHNHPNNSHISAGDIYAAVVLNSQRSFFNTSYILTGGEVYAIVVTDLQAAKAFTAAYPADQIPGYSPEFPDILFDQLQDLVTTFGSTNSGKTEAMSVILNKYNAGISLMKQDPSGDFKPINTKEVVQPNGTKTYNSIPCN